ncbi:MAG: SulP family inorganic anion transporter, partial [Nitrospirota bacterium]|nr:SulP family inorganic anion transporter [Nitrospirota bacterium]
CLTGFVQVILSLMRAGKFAMYFPISVVEGMLMAIGIMIIVKQIPSLMGSLAPPVKSIPGAVLNIPQNIQAMNPEIFLIGALSLTLLFFLSKRKERWANIIPAPLLVVGLGILAGGLLQIPNEYLIKVPYDILEQGIRLPAFWEAWQQQDLWVGLFLVVVTLTLIDGTESLATIAAIDKIDPFHRKSDPNVTLRAMGVSNMLSSLAGGLTIIPGGVKSSTNIQAGGRTLWANFYYAIFLAIFLWWGTGLINRIPLAVLAAMLIYVGWRLCEPLIFRKILEIGREQLLICLVTIIVTLSTSDLLLGVGIGILTKIIVLSFLSVQDVLNEVRTGQIIKKPFSTILYEAFEELFTNPVIRIGDGRGSRERYSVKLAANNMIPGTAGTTKDTYKIYLSSVTCMNLVKLDKTLSKLATPPNPDSNFMIIVLGRIIDHTSMEYLHHFRDQCIQAGHTCALVGMEDFQALSKHVLAFHLMKRPLQIIE